MKLRNGFVSNSSSSSFVLNKSLLSQEQIESIWKHIELGKKLNIEFTEDRNSWNISETIDTIDGYTLMNNFDMEEFFEKINIPNEAIISFYTD
jgi:hypothetical protein